MRMRSNVTPNGNVGKGCVSPYSWY